MTKKDKVLYITYFLRKKSCKIRSKLPIKEKKQKCTLTFLLLENKKILFSITVILVQQNFM